MSAAVHHEPHMRKVAYLDAQHRLVIGAGCALVVAWALPATLSPSLRAMAAWVAYAAVTLGLTWRTMLKAHPRELPSLSKLEDSSRFLIFVFVLAAAVASLLSVLALFRSADGLSHAARAWHVAASVTTIVASWLLVHTVFALRYAHIYYDERDDHGRARPGGGLEFPGNDDPDYLDFAYFSFIIGMTSQTADVNISARHLRRLALLQGLIAFVFNVVIVALTMNVVSGLLGK